MSVDCDNFITRPLEEVCSVLDRYLILVHVDRIPFFWRAPLLCFSSCELYYLSLLTLNGNAMCINRRHLPSPDFYKFTQWWKISSNIQLDRYYFCLTMFCTVRMIEASKAYGSIPKGSLWWAAQIVMPMKGSQETWGCSNYVKLVLLQGLVYMLSVLPANKGFEIDWKQEGDYVFGCVF